MVHLKEETTHLKLDLKFSRLFRLYFVLQCFIWTLAFLNCQINFQFYFSPETFNWVIPLIKYFQYFRSVQFIVVIDPNSRDLSDTILLSFVYVCVCVYVWKGLVCVMCFVPTPSVSVERQVFRQVLSALLRLWTVTHSETLVWHIWSPSMWPWMLTSADSTPLHLQLIAASRSGLKRLFTFHGPACVCAGKGNLLNSIILYWTDRTEL